MARAVLRLPTSGFSASLLGELEDPSDVFDGPTRDGAKPVACLFSRASDFDFGIEDNYSQIQVYNDIHTSHK